MTPAAASGPAWSIWSAPISSEEAQPAAPPPRVLLVTGKLAEAALRQVASEIEAAGTARPHVHALPIQVAALLNVDWLLKKLSVPPSVQVDRVILPGYCRGELEPLREKLGLPVERGPKNLHELPRHLGGRAGPPRGYGEHRIQIIAEINDAAHLPPDRILALARLYRDQGADLIDLGCDPQTDRPAWAGLGDTVAHLRDHGFDVSVDSFHVQEIAAACRAGARLVLSVNSANRDAAADWGTEVVAVPDDPQDLAGLERTIEHLAARGVPFRIDPVIEPIGFGFAASLGRYLEVRRRHPQAAMMMGIGNLTEMTEVDSAGVNALLVGFCAELGIGSVLTTQVINWARSSVLEIDIARRMMHYAVTNRVAPKHWDSRLVMLRDARLAPTSPEELAALARQLTDANVRIFADARTGQIHAMKKDVHAAGDDPFVLFDQLGIDDPSHAFYLGYEMAKAMAALTLHKNYVQDEPLRFGVLTRPETSHFERRKRRT